MPPAAPGIQIDNTRIDDNQRQTFAKTRMQTAYKTQIQTPETIFASPFLL
jgi:hypothetical protein